MRERERECDLLSSSSIITIVLLGMISISGSLVEMFTKKSSRSS